MTTTFTLVSLDFHLFISTKSPILFYHELLVVCLKTLNNFIAAHEHSTRDSRGQRLIAINPVVTEPTVGSLLKSILKINKIKEQMYAKEIRSSVIQNE